MDTKQQQTHGNARKPSTSIPEGMKVEGGEEVCVQGEDMGAWQSARSGKNNDVKCANMGTWWTRRQMSGAWKWTNVQGGAVCSKNGMKAC